MVHAKRAQSAYGPIIISRHGRPILDRSVGPKLTWQEYREWWERYERSELAQDQSPPRALQNVVSDVGIIFSSSRVRAIQTAKWVTHDREPTIDPIFNEAPLPPPMLNGVKYLPKTWNVFARMAWLQGHCLNEESVSEARIRSRTASQRLHDAANGKSVYLAAHGWFNRMLRRPLSRLGWVCVYDGGDGYWGYRIYEYRGKV